MVRKLTKAVQTIGQYEIVRKLADGGMSSVYQARDPATGQMVAVKVPAAHAAKNPVLRKRFEQEYRATRKLDHPHLVRGLEFGDERGRPFLVMEYVEGRSLHEWVEQQKRLPEAAAVRILTQVAEGLGKAHEKGLVHRDVKPENILVDTEGNAKLADLGLVKDAEDDLGLTRPGGGLGTLNFMAPEQFDDAKNVDGRGDIYSLAATLYFAVTGEVPFRGRGSLAMLKKKLVRDLRPPRHLVPELSERLDRAVMRALHPRPEERPSTCFEFASDLTGVSTASNSSNLAQTPQPLRLTGRERRAAVRYPSQLNSACRALGGDPEYRWMARVGDISSGGLQLILERRFEPGTVLAIELQDRVGQPRRTALVRVVRVQPHTQRKWSLGCVFDYRLSEDDVLTLR